MAKLDNEAKERIRNAVKAAEKKTSGEFVTVIARKSDNYLHIPLLWASIFALVVPVIFIFILDNHQANLIFDVQAGVFIGMYLLLQINSLKMLFVPRSIRQLRARRNAFLQFHQLGVSGTKERSGILLFVSLSEHFVEIIADEGINARVDKDYWQNIINEFIARVKQNRVEEGFIYAVEKCAEVLEKHFPVSDNDINELSDGLVEI